uniref:RING-type domain-containing protein n=1 Tax=Pavo cristatus TaxID=9049 RepID=A0A8C9FHT8_PAVCR
MPDPPSASGPTMARALQALGEQLQAETTCPLCLELFSRPMLTACGHSLCSSCAQDLLGSPPRPTACPQCRAIIEPGSLRMSPLRTH